MLREPGLWNRATRGLQRKINSYIPEQVHAAVTAVIRQMTQAVLAGSNYTATAPLLEGDLAAREKLVAAKVDRYRRTAAIEGGVTGAGGFVMGLADFPLLISIKLKLLFEIAALYGHSGDDYRERLYLLFVFQLAFSSDAIVVTSTCAWSTGSISANDCRPRSMNSTGASFSRSIATTSISRSWRSLYR